MSYNENLNRGPGVAKRPIEERVLDSSFVISVRVTREERDLLEEAGRMLQQEMPAVILKQLAFEYGLWCLQNEQTRITARLVYENTRKNIQRGIMQAQPKIKRM